MIILLIGMAAAFLLGAYVRRPFCIFKKNEETAEKPDKTEESEISEEEKKKLEQWDNILSYTGKEQK